MAYICENCGGEMPDGNTGAVLMLAPFHPFIPKKRPPVRAAVQLRHFMVLCIQVAVV
jgi:PHP family Zn ribbon phosphoesterase